MVRLLYNTPLQQSWMKVLGYEFDVTGKITGETEILKLTSATRAQLQSMLEPLSQKVSFCLHAHEECIAKIFESRTNFTRLRTNNRVLFNAMIEQALCEDRGPQCAHRTRERTADPFGDEINYLSTLGILQKESWMSWHKNMVKEIRENDDHTALFRWETESRTLESREAHQRPIIEELESKRVILLGCVTRVLEDFDALPQSFVTTSMTTSTVE